MINPQIIFIPCLILILLTFLVLGIMFRRRVKEVKSGNVKASHYKTYSTDAKESKLTIQAHRNFSNLHESPPIFYILCIMIFITGNVTNQLIGLSWLYLIFRIAHSIIHLTTNKIPARMIFFAGSWVVIVAMSIVLITKII